MSDNIHIKRRQKRRSKPLLTTRNIVTLILLSLAVYGAFLFWVGDPSQGQCDGDCENIYSAAGYILGFFLMILGVIAAGAVVGSLFSFMRRKRRDTSLSTLLEQQQDKKQEDI